MATFLALKQDVYRRTGHLSSPDAAVVTRVESFLNRWNRKILSAKGMDSLRRSVVTQASVADQQQYGIALQSVRFFTESTSDRRLFERTLSWYRTHYPDPTNLTGTPRFYVPMGFARIHTRPANASELFVKSTSASDTNTASVSVVRSGGYKRLLSVSMTGVTAVSLGTAITDVIDIDDFYVSVAAVGTITLHEDSGAGTELSRIPIGALYQRFYRYALAPTPSAAITYTIDGIAPIADLSNDTDEPFPNPDFHDILVDGAVSDEWASRGRAAEAKELRRDVDARIRELRGTLLEWPDPYRLPSRSFEDTIHLPVEEA